MKALILYFSGTGNTAAVSRLIQISLEKNGIQTQMQSIEEPLEFADCDFLVLGCPKYYEYPALYVVDYLKDNLPAQAEIVPAFLFCTMSGTLETDFSGMEKILRRKNYSVTMEKSFSYANNYMILRMFPSTEPETLRKNVAAITESIDPLIEKFLHGIEQKETVKPWLSALERLTAVSFTKLMPRFQMKYSATDDCISCNLCANNCPIHNITMKNGKPEFGKDCIFCMRCINCCPKNAILYNGKKCPQYICKEKF